MLVHANLGRLHNGATGTVEAVDADAMALRLDDGDAVVVSAEVVAGRHPEGTPNLSHAWARTVDGAQGGTWRQVHLLGTQALDRFRGYVGQSRSQLPTHTWNTRPEADHPVWLVADDRSAPEVVADAMARNEPNSFAAIDDPWVLDRQLRTEREEHDKALATRPPDRAEELTEVRRALAHAEDELGWATKGLELRRRQRDHLGALHRLRPGGRDDIARADHALEAARLCLDCSESAVTQAQTAAAEVTTGMVQRSEWGAAQGWRLARVDEIDAALTTTGPRSPWRPFEPMTLWPSASSAFEASGEPTTPSYEA